MAGAAGVILAPFRHEARHDAEARADFLGAGLEQDRAVGRFEREARATSQLRHPNIVSVFDFGHHLDGAAYLVMELVEGTTELAPEALPDAFAQANEEVQRRAVEYAKRLDEKPVVLVVWDGQPGDGPGGTADNVELWRFQGVEPLIIDPRAL